MVYVGVVPAAGTIIPAITSKQNMATMMAFIHTLFMGHTSVDPVLLSGTGKQGNNDNEMRESFPDFTQIIPRVSTGLAGLLHAYTHEDY